MSLSIVQICNIALSRVGITQTIDDIDEGSAEALACKTMYEATRDAALADWAWPFAERSAGLALVATLTGQEWVYSLRRPPDCLLIRRLVSGTRTGQGIPFGQSSDSSGGLILCDQSSGTLIYTAKIDDPGLWSQPFSMALSWRLAAEISIPLARTQSVVDRAWSNYGAELSKAKSVQANEDVTDLPADAEAISGRE